MPQGYKRVQAKTTIPIAGGECSFMRWPALMIIVIRFLMIMMSNFKIWIPWSNSKPWRALCLHRPGVKLHFGHKWLDLFIIKLQSYPFSAWYRCIGRLVRVFEDLRHRLNIWGGLAEISWDHHEHIDQDDHWRTLSHKVNRIDHHDQIDPQVNIVPHVWGSAVGLAAGVHAMMIMVMIIMIVMIKRTIMMIVWRQVSTPWQPFPFLLTLPSRCHLVDSPTSFC